MVWSSYNYFCNPALETGCGPTRLIQPHLHKRSPELFDEIIRTSMHNKSAVSPLIFQEPCAGAHKHYASIVHQLWEHVRVEDTLILSSEDLDDNPRLVWSAIANATGWHYTIDFDKFKQTRYNSSSPVRSGANRDSNLYPASDFKPMLNTARNTLDHCWENDCLWSYLVTKHKYPSCYRPIYDIISKEEILKYLKSHMEVAQTAAYLTTSMYRGKYFFGNSET